MSISDFVHLDRSIPFHEKTFNASLENDHHEQDHYCEYGQTSSGHHSCHNIRLRQLLLLAMLSLLVLAGIFAWSCINWHSLSNPEFNNLVGRDLLHTEDLKLNNLFTKEHSQ